LGDNCQLDLEKRSVFDQTQVFDEPFLIVPVTTSFGRKATGSSTLIGAALPCSTFELIAHLAKTAFLLKIASCLRIENLCSAGTTYVEVTNPSSREPAASWLESKKKSRKRATSQGVTRLEKADVSLPSTLRTGFPTLN
jgi:hypothetical protein